MQDWEQAMVQVWVQGLASAAVPVQLGDWEPHQNLAQAEDWEWAFGWV
jgi:hypothetical protein